MLLGYKVEIEYLNNFINFLTENHKGNLKNDFIKISFKKELLNFKLYKKLVFMKSFINIFYN